MQHLIKILVNKPVYLDLSILEIGKMVVYEFWYNYVKPKYGEKAKLCYMNTYSVIVYIKTKAIQEDIAEDVGGRFDTSNYELGRPLTTGKNKKLIESTKNELCGKIMKVFPAWGAETYIFLTSNNNEDKK